MAAIYSYTTYSSSDQLNFTGLNAGFNESPLNCYNGGLGSLRLRTRPKFGIIQCYYWDPRRRWNINPVLVFYSAVNIPGSVNVYTGL
jgi:hypothetical protein